MEVFFFFGEHLDQRFQHVRDYAVHWPVFSDITHLKAPKHLPTPFSQVTSAAKTF